MSDETEITIQAYNQTAREYAKNVANLGKIEYVEKFSSLLKPGSLILDLGCGSGRDAKLFSDRGFQVQGIDLSEELLKIAQEVCPNADFRQLNIQKLDFKDEYFDGAWSCASLLHIPKIKIPPTIAGISRVLKKGGIFYIGVKELEDEDEKLIKDERYSGNIIKFYSYFRRGELETVLEQKGFEILESSGSQREEKYLKCRVIDILSRKK